MEPAAGIDWQTVGQWGIQVPALGMMFAIFVVACVTAVILIRAGLAHMSQTVQDFRETSTENVTAFRQTTHECVNKLAEVTEETSKALDRNTKAFGRVEAKLDVLDEIARMREKQREEKA
jgi:predicted nuclease with TOPRIM domain